VTVLQDIDTFSPAIEHGGIRIFNLSEVSAQPLPHFFSMVPPEHTAMRKSLSQGFAATRLAELETFARSKFRSLIGKNLKRRHADFATEIAAPFVLSVFTCLLDVPEEDGPELQRWSEAVVGDDDTEYQLSEDYRRMCLTEIDDYSKALLAKRRSKPGADLASCLAKPIARDATEDAHFSANFAAMLLAGNETTRHSISNAIWALSLFPHQKRKLLADKNLLKSAVKEALRWTSPLLHIRRTAACDTRIGGKQIRRGDKVVAWYVSANRDEDIWSNPDCFDIERFNRDGVPNHIAFGAGPHHCLGWRLAELQLTVALEETLAAFPDVTCTAPPDRIRSNLIYGIKRLPISFAGRQSYLIE
jgi:cytochrome P450